MNNYRMSLHVSSLSDQKKFFFWNILVSISTLKYIQYSIFNIVQLLYMLF